MNYNKPLAGCPVNEKEAARMKWKRRCRRSRVTGKYVAPVGGEPRSAYTCLLLPWVVSNYSAISKYKQHTRRVY